MSVLSLPEAKQHLNISTTTHDDELQAVIDAAEAAIAQRVGPLEPTPVTVRMQGRTNTLVLPVTPVESVMSLTPTGGTPLPVDGLDVDPGSGVVGYLNSTAAFTASSYTVTYLAGRIDVPADLLLAVKELVRHFWETQRGGSAVRPGSTSAPPVPGASYAFPTRVNELLAPHVQVFGFA